MLGDGEGDFVGLGRGGRRPCPARQLLVAKLLSIYHIHIYLRIVYYVPTPYLPTYLYVYRYVCMVRVTRIMHGIRRSLWTNVTYMYENYRFIVCVYYKPHG